jgi:glycosyl transferase, family 25
MKLSTLIVIVILLVIVIVLIIKFNVIYDLNIKEHFNFDNNISIYVINLEERKDKKNNIMTELNNNNLNAEIIKAYNGKYLDLEKLNPISEKRKLRKGEIGCYLSHFECWLKFLKSNQEYALILEDDAVLGYDFQNKLSKIYNDLNGIEFDFMYLTDNCGEPCKSGTILSETSYSPDNVGYGMHGYIINRKMLIYLINNAFPMIEPVDVYVENIHKKNIFKFIKLKTPIIYARDFNDSDTIAIK